VVTALGEIPEPLDMMREFHRVLKPTGTLVVGEFFDRHYIPLVTLMRRANATDFDVTAWLGVPFAYYAQLRPSVHPAALSKTNGHVPSEHHTPSLTV
jgi:ubiquinone/menaquinone biosynthesis C-methylase UbiE